MTTGATPTQHALERRPPLAGSAALREILVPSDLSPESDRAMEHARILAQRFDARVTLYHVVEVPHQDYGSWTAEQGDAVWSATRREAFRELSRRGAAACVRHEVVVERALSARRALVGYVRARRPDLVVMATHGSHGPSHPLLGSATEKVLQHGRRPLLCVRATAHGGTLPYRRLLVPTDLSPESRRALPIVALLARSLGAEVIALHVAPLVPLPNCSGPPPGPAAGVPGEDTLLKFVAPELEGLHVTARIERGLAWDRIVRCAGEVDADLVVMATRGHDSIADRVLGSHTERVVRHAPCPVLVA